MSRIAIPPKKGGDHTGGQEADGGATKIFFFAGRGGGGFPLVGQNNTSLGRRLGGNEGWVVCLGREMGGGKAAENRIGKEGTDLWACRKEIAGKPEPTKQKGKDGESYRLQ